MDYQALWIKAFYLQPPAQKSHVVESQIKLLLWPSFTEKQDTINHMIIFNDLICNFYQCSIQGFCKGIFMFLVSALAKKKMKRQLNFQESQKKYIFKNKIYFCLKKKSNVWLDKKVVFVFHTIFKNLIS